MITYKSITDACRQDPECKDGYSMLLRGDDLKYVTHAVNQGIDSHLEACSVQGRDSYQVKNGGPVSGLELHCKVSPESLPVLLRRLACMGDEPHLLASDILSSLGFEDADPFDIVCPVDETVVCKLCGKKASLITAHRHQDAYVGEECCWDERLRVTE